MFGLFFGMGKEVFVDIEEGIGHLKMFIFQLLNFPYLFCSFGVFGA